MDVDSCHRRDTNALLGEDGYAVWPDALDDDLVRTLKNETDELYQRIDELRERLGPWGVERQLPELRFLPTASSFAMGALPSGTDVVGALSRAWIEPIEYFLGGPAVCDLDLCWVRRQYPGVDAPPEHAGHSWHQDGACGHDFTTAKPSNGLARMLTLWITLDDCGLHAPGLELIAGSPVELCLPTQLDRQLLSERAAALRRPRLQAGDAIAMTGHILHRTHVTSDMSRTRSCVELRFLLANPIPARFRGHTFASLSGR